MALRQYPKKSKADFKKRVLHDIYTIVDKVHLEHNDSMEQHGWELTGAFLKAAPGEYKLLFEELESEDDSIVYEAAIRAVPSIKDKLKKRLSTGEALHTDLQVFANRIQASSSNLSEEEFRTKLEEEIAKNYDL